VKGNVDAIVYNTRVRGATGAVRRHMNDKFLRALVLISYEIIDSVVPEVMACSEGFDLYQQYAQVVSSCLGVVCDF
jgi:hypothetical protein